MKKRLLVVATAIVCLCFAVLFVRSWISESAKGVYLMTVLWGGVLLLSLFSLVYRIRAKG